MMEMYACMLLHKAGKEINEGNIKKVLEAAGASVNDAKVKAVVAALEGVDIEKTIKEASVPMVAAPVAEAKEHKKEEKPKEDEKKSEEQAAAGLSSLFG